MIQNQTPLIDRYRERPSRQQAIDALQNFLPRAGKEYARWRNYDYGSSGHTHVSQLSPFIRCRAITEPEIIRSVLGFHTPHAAEKFIQEVCWRTYWKGWLELRPSVWTDYLETLSELKNSYTNTPLYQAALKGETSSRTFNAFAHELCQTGYLHNHARMWMASIWIFTFGLPWQLGADFFFQHLLDGDPASNTLSWRWVAGQHTRGKSYIARSSNIEKYTDGRLGVGEHFNEHPTEQVPDPVIPPIQSLARDDQPPNGNRIGWLVHEEDLSIDQWLFPSTPDPRSIFIVDNARQHAEMGISDKVQTFRQGLLKDFERRIQQADNPAIHHQAVSAKSIRQWIQETGIEAIIVARPSTGIWNTPVAEAINAAQAAGISVHQQRHPWDRLLYPHATHGYFRFKKQIPRILKLIQADFDRRFQPRTNRPSFCSNLPST